MRKRRGFTLIELLVVITIVATLSAIAVPQYQRAVWKSKFMSMMAGTKALANAQDVYYVSNRRHTTDMEDLDVEVKSDATTTYSLFKNIEWAGAVASRRDLFDGEVLLVVYNHYGTGGGSVYCGASPNNDNATWLCKQGLNGQFAGWFTGDGNSVNENTAVLYRLSGSGATQGWDFNGDNVLNVNDVTALIDYKLKCKGKDCPVNNDNLQCIINVILTGKTDFSVCDDVGGSMGGGNSGDDDCDPDEDEDCE